MTDYRIQLEELGDVVRRSASLLGLISSGGDILLASLKAGGTVLTCGNGGSAADASHMSEELVGRFRGERRSLPSVCLSSDGPLLTCIGNDYGIDALFSRQIEGLGKVGDVLVVFSTSGNSANIRTALHVARRAGMKSISLLGKDGGKCKGLSDCDIIVPSNSTARIQEMHTFIMHSWLEAIEQEKW